MGMPVLHQYINEEFTLNYYKDKCESIISIKTSSKFSLFQESTREFLVEITIGNKEIEKTTDELHQYILYECKMYNKFKYKIKKVII